MLPSTSAVPVTPSPASMKRIRTEPAGLSLERYREKRSAHQTPEAKVPKSPPLGLPFLLQCGLGLEEPPPADAAAVHLPAAGPPTRKSFMPDMSSGHAK